MFHFVPCQQQIDHPNLVNLMYYSDENDVLELYMEYIQDTLHRVIVAFRERCKLIPVVLIKVASVKFHVLSTD